MIKKIVILFTLVFGFQVMGEDLGESEKILWTIDQGLEKDEMILSKGLSQALKYYEKKHEKKFLIEVLKKFKKILKTNDAYFRVEHFTMVHMKEPLLLNECLNEALDPEEKKVFMEHLNNIVREYNEGNG